MAKFIRHLVLLTIAYLCFACAMSMILTHSGFNKQRDIALSDAKLETAKETQPDLLIVGSSRVYRHFDPTVVSTAMPESESKSVYNLGVPGMWPPRENVYLHRVLNETSASVIVVELNPPQSLMGNIRSSATLRSLSPATALNSIQTIHETSDNVPAKLKFAASFGAAMAYKYLGIGLMRTEFMDYDSEEQERAERDLAASKEGFMSLDHELTLNPDLEKRKKVSAKQLEKRQAENIAKYEREMPKVSSTMLSTCEDFIRRAEDKGCRLVFVLSPRLGNDHLKIAYPVFEKLPFKNKIDMSDPGRHPEFYLEEFSFDNGHLNEKGALLFSQAFANKLKALLTESQPEAGQN